MSDLMSINQGNLRYSEAPQVILSYEFDEIRLIKFVSGNLNAEKIKHYNWAYLLNRTGDAQRPDSRSGISSAHHMMSPEKKAIIFSAG